MSNRSTRFDLDPDLKNKETTKTRIKEYSSRCESASKGIMIQFEGFGRQSAAFLPVVTTPWACKCFFSADTGHCRYS